MCSQPVQQELLLDRWLVDKPSQSSVLRQSVYESLTRIAAASESSVITCRFEIIISVMMETGSAEKSKFSNTAERPMSCSVFCLFASLAPSRGALVDLLRFASASAAALRFRSFTTAWSIRADCWSSALLISCENGAAWGVRDKCINNIRTAFSTLLTVDAGKCEIEPGDQLDKAFMMRADCEGRCLARMLQLFTTAAIMSGLLCGSEFDCIVFEWLRRDLRARVEDSHYALDEFCAFCFQCSDGNERMIRRAERQVGVVWFLQLYSAVNTGNIGGNGSNLTLGSETPRV